MINRLNVASIYVLDKEEALDFYVNKLGLEKGNDVSQGDYRWLTVRVPGDEPTEISLEQPGCLHANMDLFKWAYKLDPFVPAELVADCFELALEVRELDMCASPYDLAPLGYEPVAIETPEGRAEYVRRQAAFTARAEPLRAALLELSVTLRHTSAVSS